MSSTVQIGMELENYVVNKFKEIGYPKARRSKGSGNRGEAGDIAGQETFVCECKKRTKPNITIRAEVWKKLNHQIPLHSKRLPLYLLENDSNIRLAVLDIDDFFNILKGYLENEQSKAFKQEAGRA